MKFTPLSDPLAALHDATKPGVLAVITGIDGPSYRPLGAVMAIMNDGHRVGSLSSGCIEADVGLHAKTCLADGQTKTLVYGRNSPFKDIQLPCGGGLNITLIPSPSRDVMAQVSQIRLRRDTVALQLDGKTGALSLGHAQPTGWEGSTFHILIEPELQFFVFGKGPEASTFAATAKSSGFETLLLSPDAETRDFAAQVGCATRPLDRMAFPQDVRPDARSVVVLFFHDHEWEPPILHGALQTPALYVGAQGSLRARDERVAALLDLGTPPEAIERLKGPIGLVPSARDARTLAISVLAEVLDIAQSR